MDLYGISFRMYTKLYRAEFIREERREHATIWFWLDTGAIKGINFPTVSVTILWRRFRGGPGKHHRSRGWWVKVPRRIRSDKTGQIYWAPSYALEHLFLLPCCVVWTWLLDCPAFYKCFQWENICSRSIFFAYRSKKLQVLFFTKYLWIQYSSAIKYILALF